MSVNPVPLEGQHYECHVCNGNGSPGRPYRPSCEAAWSHDMLWLKDPQAKAIEDWRRDSFRAQYEPDRRPPARTVMQLGKDPHNRTIAFCSDGAAFVLIEKQEGKRRLYAWRHLPAVPGTPAAGEDDDPGSPIAILNNIYRIVRAAMTQSFAPELTGEAKEATRRQVLGDALEDVAVQLNQVRDGLPQ